ncbi:unnamed protein product [Symbiodinium natans]|uniref:Apple domain-containing protein n=1 Tax=Symbiodinium natans TaxID=878477 RepID=A0A812T668_9DINO|nr:unnamed protein product [Symbiodinium natans]
MAMVRAPWGWLALVVAFVAEAGYSSLGKGTVWVEEGSDLGRVLFEQYTHPGDHGTGGACANFCDATEQCNGFAICDGPPITCWLKSKEVPDPASEATKSKSGCTSFYYVNDTDVNDTETRSPMPPATYVGLGNDIVWVDEGCDLGYSTFDLSSSPNDGTPGACAHHCDAMPGCTGFAKCHGRTRCWMKYKEVANPASEPTRSVSTCTSFYKVTNGSDTSNDTAFTCHAAPQAGAALAVVLAVIMTA